VDVEELLLVSSRVRARRETAVSCPCPRFVGADSVVTPFADLAPRVSDSETQEFTISASAMRARIAAGVEGG